MVKNIEIMDTTLRDGEQTSGVSFSVSEKLQIAQLLINELKVDRIEVASARVSKGELEAVKQIAAWADSIGKLEQIEVLTFVDGGASLKWLKEAGVKTQNLLTKGSLNHLTHQLKKTPSQHFKEIADSVRNAKSQGVETNVYLEDWSNGMKNSKAYVMEFISFLETLPIKRVMLPDTLGVLHPLEAYEFIKEVRTAFPNLHLDFHAHNDYDMSVGNCVEAIKAGVDGVHLTINGMGERAGNAPMASTIAVIHDFLKDFTTHIDEKSLFKVSSLVENFSSFVIPVNKPIVGENVFTQTAGIHADGDSKNNLYFNDLLPERFGRKRKYALGKTSGKANIQKNLEELGLSLKPEEVALVTQRIIELGDKKELVTQDDLPYIISDVLDDQSYQERIKIKHYSLNHASGLKPTASLCIEVNENSFEESASGDGQYDAFIRALQKIFEQLEKDLPSLVDYAVRIPPGSNSDALCETRITWLDSKKKFTTRGLDSDQTVSAIKATEKMLNLIYQENI